MASVSLSARSIKAIDGRDHGVSRRDGTGERAGLPVHRDVRLGDAGAASASSEPEEESVFVFPATPAQRRFWLLDQLQPGGNSALNVSISLWLSGTLDRHALERALREVVRRQEALRTTFACEEGQLRQLIAPALPLHMELVDARDFPEAERDRVVPHLIDEEAHRPFDLARGPLFRTRLVRAGEEEHFLLLSLHHIICDGWSNGVLTRELGALYGAYVQDRPSPLPDLPIQFADYAEWQQQRLQDESAFAGSLAYWRGQLGGALSILEMPTDHPRRARVDRRVAEGAMRSLLLPRELGRNLRAVSVRESVSPFMLFLAAFETLLHRYTGETDIVLSTPSANRQRSEIEGLIGLFVNPLILRSDLSGAPSVRELLQRVRRMALDAFAHSELPFERIIDELRPERLPVSFLYQTSFLQPADLPGGLKLTPLPSASGGALFELTGAVLEEAGGTRVCIEYNAELFHSETIDRLLGHYQTLLEGFAADPLASVSKLPILTSAERRQFSLDEDGVRGSHPPALDESLTATVAAHAARNPDSPAMRLGETVLSYRALEARAERLAHCLRTLNAGGTPPKVGICVTGMDLAVAVLASAKAGAASLFVDPSALAQASLAGLSVLLTGEGRAHEHAVATVAAALPRDKVRTLADLEKSGGAFQPDEDDAPADGLFLFGSQSAGPATENSAFSWRVQAFARRCRCLAEIYDIQPADRVVCGPAAPSIDFLESAIGVWLAGAAVVASPPGLFARPPSALRAWLEEERATILQIPGAAWERFALWLTEKNLVLPKTLRVVVVSEESSGPSQAKAASPVESAGVRVITHRAWPESGGAAMLDGRAVPGVRLAVLDSSGQPVPAGVPGQLCIFTSEGGEPSVAASPLHTGDWARWRADGAVEILGHFPEGDEPPAARSLLIARRQVEAVLATHEKVRQAKVLPQRRDGAGGPWTLTAYVVPARTGLPISGLLLRRFLKKRLPEDSLPSAIVLLDEFPLTSEGLLDTAALPPPQAEAPDAIERPYLTLQHQIVQVWEDILGVRPIGIADDFFALGGNSLLAMRMLRRIEQVCGKVIMPSALFTRATVEHLAGEIARSASEHAPEILKIQENGAKTPFFYLHGDLTGGGFYSLRLSGALGGDQPFYAMPPQDVRGLAPSEMTVEAMAASHWKTMRELRPHGPYVIGGFCIGGLVAFELARQIAASGEKVERLVIIDAEVKSRPLRALRSSVNALGAVLRWDAEEQLARFGRYWYIMARLDRWAGLELRAKSRIAYRRLSERLQPLIRAARPRGGCGANPSLEGAPPGQRWDVPSVFLWATAGYRPRLYEGPVSLLLSSDLIRGRVNPARRWRHCARSLKVHSLDGSHLACITEHVEALAYTIRSCLGSP